MARKRRPSAFTLSFLDCMACGFGAVVLLFFIINHATVVRSDTLNEELLAEVDRLEREVLDGEKNKVQLVNALEQTEQDVVETQGRAQQVIENIEEKKVELARYQEDTTAKREHINRLKADIQAAEEEAKRLQASQAGREDQGEAVRSVVGAGDRQYLTGLKVGGERILVLVDASASMLDEQIVNIIRRRNLPDAQKSQAPKWRRAVATVSWITAQIPPDSQFQIYTFDTEPQPLLEGTGGAWQAAQGGRALDRAVERLDGVVPANGTSLLKAFAVIEDLQPRPDNIYLLVDGLPTQGRSPPGSATVSGEARLELFERAVNGLARGIPVNVILFPIEGDPRAASAYWQLVQATGGSLISPSRDWP